MSLPKKSLMGLGTVEARFMTQHTDFYARTCPPPPAERSGGGGGGDRRADRELTKSAATRLRHRLDPPPGTGWPSRSRLSWRNESCTSRSSRTGPCAPVQPGQGRRALLRTALDRLAKPRPTRDGPPDPTGRPPGGGPTPWSSSPNGHWPPATCPTALGTPTPLTVTVDLAILRKDLGALAAAVEFGLPPSAEAVRRTACATQALPVIFGGTGQHLDIGRLSRTVPGPLRRALIARDQSCVLPGCDRPASGRRQHPVHLTVANVPLFTELRAGSPAWLSRSLRGSPW
jgi:Domain of unknown function (DUF222)